MCIVNKYCLRWHCAANPINFIDPTGNYYIFANISESDKEIIKNIIESGTQKKIAVSFENNKLITSLAEGVKDDEITKTILMFTNNQADENNINIKNNSDVIIGEAETGSIDLADINNLGSIDSANALGALMHELAEQQYIQHPSPKVKDENIIPKAHSKATEIEGIINNIKINHERTIDSNNNTIEFQYNPDRNSNTGFPKKIIIKLDNNNVIRREDNP